MNMEKVPAGTFYGYEMFIEVPEVKAEFIKNQWIKYSAGIVIDQKLATEVRLNEEVKSLTT